MSLETDATMAGDRVYVALRMVRAIGAEAESISCGIGLPMVVTFCWHGHSYELALGGDLTAPTLGLGSAMAAAMRTPTPDPAAMLGDLARAAAHPDPLGVEAEARELLNQPTPPDMEPGYASHDLDGMLQHLVDEWGALGVAIKLLAGIPAHGRDEWLQRLASGDYMGAPVMLGWELPADPEPEPWLPGVNLAVQLALVAIMRDAESPLGLDAMVDEAGKLLGLPADAAELVRLALGRT